MKTNTSKNRKKIKRSKVYKFSFNVLIIMSLLLVFSSCEDEYYGPDGRSGDAYLSLTWANEIPEYLDAVPPDPFDGTSMKYRPETKNIYSYGAILEKLPDAEQRLLHKTKSLSHHVAF